MYFDTILPLDIISIYLFINYMYLLLKDSIKDLPILCQRSECKFINPYIQNYDFDLSIKCCEDISFILELQKFHLEKILSDLLHV